MNGGELAAAGTAGPILSLIIFYLRGWLPKLTRVQTTAVVVVLVLGVSIINAAIAGELEDYLQNVGLLAASLAGWYTFVMKGLGLEASLTPNGFGKLTIK